MSIIEQQIQRSPIVHHLLTQLDSMAESLSAIQGNTGDPGSDVRHRADPFTITGDGTPFVVAPRPLYLAPGYSWQLLSIFAQTGAPAVNAGLAFFVDDTGVQGAAPAPQSGIANLAMDAPAGLQNGIFTKSFTEGVFIPESSSLVIVAYGLGAGVQIGGRVLSKGFSHGRALDTDNAG